MSTLDVVAEILREVAPRALNARQIVELAAGRLPTSSRTPETVVSRDLAMEVKRHETRSRFLRVDRGEFVLKEALPSALFNEIEPYAAAWSRNLVAAGEIAHGVVDERSIRDLKPADVASYRQFHAFSGIGIWSRALRDAGIPDDANVWSGSCPCQGFSQAGRRLGFADERHLWPEWFRLISACRPALLFGEQVSSKDGLAWFDAVRLDLESANYSLRVLDTPAACVGAPHRRQRFYFVAYARERGCEILSAPWLHDRGQPRYDASGRGSVDGGITVVLSDTAGTRSRIAEDIRSDRGDAIACTEAADRGPTGHLELERGGASDDACALSDAECVVRDEGRGHLAHGRSEVEPDRHGEADGAIFGEGDGAVELGDAGIARGGGHTGEVPRAEGAGEGERIEARDLADESIAPGADDGAGHRFIPGDRIRIDGDPGWGGAVRGYWAEDVEWIYCRPEPGHKDGRWRPAKSGHEPLADGSAPGVGRTRAARLRCFGNAIVLPLATAFVGAVIDAFADAVQANEVPAIEPAAAAAVVVQDTAWTGPREGEITPTGLLYGRLPGERWPYGPPSAHEDCCNLFPHRGSPGGLFCDCAASAVDGVESGVAAS